MKFEMSGYQLMISGDIFRGRYREDITKAKPIAANEVLEYTLPLPHVNHTILPGHRLMIQIQSTWFPLYDRNPQTFVPSIMSAPDAAYKKQQHPERCLSAPLPRHRPRVVEPSRGQAAVVLAQAGRSQRSLAI